MIKMMLPQHRRDFFRLGDSVVRQGTVTCSLHDPQLVEQRLPVSYIIEGNFHIP